MNLRKLVNTSVVLLITGLALTACSGGEPQAAKDLASYQSQTIEWGGCNSAYGRGITQSKAFANAPNTDCTKVLVPASYSGGASTKEYSIALMRIGYATESDYMGTIFINPGGPGASGIEQLVFSEFPKELLKHYDIIGFDPRGVGFSKFSDGTSIKCSDRLDFESYFDGEGSPANEAEEKLNEDILNEYYADCAERNPDWWTMSTENVVSDLELMRSVLLDDEPLNFIGSSYGTTIASLYVSRYPENVGKIVLDSPTSSDSDIFAAGLENVKSQEAKLNMLLDAYADQKGISTEAAFQKLLKFKQLADDDKLVGDNGIYPSKEQPSFMISPESLFRKGLFALNYLPEEQAKRDFISAMDALEANRSNRIFEWYGLVMDGYDPSALEGGSSLDSKEIIRSNRYEVMEIVNSLDYAPAELTEEEQREFYQQTLKLAPRSTKLSMDSSGYINFKPSKIKDWVEIALADDQIPDPATEPLARENKSGKELLVIGSINESVTPYAFSKETAELLKSPLISVNDSVHAPAAYYNNSCLNRILVDYFISDKEIKNTTCNR